MTKVIDYDEAVALLKRAVEEKGADYVYPISASGSCEYVRVGEASCIVGHVINYVSPEALAVIGVLENHNRSWPVADMQVERIENLYRELSREAYETLPVKFTRKATEFLGEAQSRQDAGYSWGETLARALTHVEAYNAADN